MFRCTRCHTKRYEAWGKITGMLLFRQYVYPDNYWLEDEEDRYVTEYRKMYVRKLMANKR